MFNSHACRLADWRQKHVLKKLFFYLIQKDTCALLSPKNIYLLRPFLLIFTSTLKCAIGLLLHVFILTTIHLCVRAKNRNSEISGVLKLPEELKADFRDWLAQGVYMSHKTSSRSAEMHLCGRKRAVLGAIGTPAKALSVQTSCLVSPQKTLMGLFQAFCTFA